MKTNIDMLTELMNYSRHGALMQVFVMEAICRYADQCIAAGAENFDTAFLSGAAWVGSAQEAKDAIDKHLSRDPSDPIDTELELED